MKTTSADYNYWELHAAGKEVCLSCPLADCIWDTAEPERRDCPLERELVRQSVTWRRHSGRVARALEGLLAGRQAGVSIIRLSEVSGVSSATVYKLMDGGLFVYHKTPARGRGQPAGFRLTGVAG